MSMKKQARGHQETLWIPHDAIASSPGHPFYEHLERVLREERFDAFVESKCSSYYTKTQGRPSIPPGVYFRMLLVDVRGVGFGASDGVAGGGGRGVWLMSACVLHAGVVCSL